MVCGNLTDKQITLPELEIPDRTSCPYCSKNFENNKKLSGHIYKIHIKSK